MTDDSPDRMPPGEKAALAGAALLLIAAVVAELVCEPWRDWWQARPLFAGVLSGGLLVGPLLFVLERSLDRKATGREREAAEAEAGRWQAPALDALDAYATAAKRTGDAFARAVRDAHDQTGDLGEGTTSEQVARLADGDPEAFAPLAVILRAATTECAAHAVGALLLLTLSPPLLEHRDAVSAVQQATTEMAALSEAIGSGTGDAEKRARLATVAGDRERSVEALVVAVRAGRG